MAKFCVNCGTELGEGSAFCSSCGTKIQQNNAQPAAPQNAAQPGSVSSAAPLPPPAAVPPSPAAAPAQPPMAAPHASSSASAAQSQPQSAFLRSVQSRPQPDSALSAKGALQARLSRFSDGSVQNQNQHSNQNQPAKKTGCGQCFLSVVLSGLIVVQLFLAAFWCPGFLLSGSSPKSDPGRAVSAKNSPDRTASAKSGRSHAVSAKNGSDRTASAKSGRNRAVAAKNGSPRAVSENKSSAAKRKPSERAALPALAGSSISGSISRIKVRYSEEDLKKAPKREAVVSPQNCRADCGDVKADFRSWNLKGEDTFVVRTLPDLRDEEAGYTIKAYDFAMASGQNEFAADVELTIPRTAGEDEGFCVAFNEETGRWERVYSEISEDGRFYKIYTDHFCGKGVAIPTNDLTKALARGVVSEDLEKEQIRDFFSIFCYVSDSSKYARMTSKVYVLYNFLWEFFQRKYVYSIKDIVDVIQRKPEDKELYVDPCPQLSDGSANVDAANSVSDLLGTTPNTPFFKQIPKVTTLISLFSTASKMKSEINQGKTVSDAAWNNKLNIVSTSVGGLGLAVSHPAIAVAGVALYAAAKADGANAVRELTPREQIYRDYFYRHYEMRERKVKRIYNKAGQVVDREVKFETVRRFYYDLEPGDERLSKPDTGNIRRIPDLTDAENKHLKHYINSGGLPGSDPRRQEEIPAEWAYTLRILYNIRQKNHPELLTKNVLDFYTNYAETFWQMSDQKRQEYINAAIKDRNYTKSAADYKLDDYKETYTKNLVTEMMRSHSELIFELTSKYERESKLEIEDLIENTLMPKLNTRMEFRVVDETLEDPKDFKNSVYGASIDIGRDAPEIDNPNIVYDADYSKAETPMAFGIKKGGGFEPVSGPRFIPRRHEYDSEEHSSKILEDPNYRYRHGKYTAYYTLPCDKKNFFPYMPNFLPRAVSGDNLVFTCTYYNYLLMGAPTAVIFHQMGEQNDYKAVPFVLPAAPDQDGVMRIQITAPKKENKAKKVVYVFDHVKGGGFADLEIEALEESLKNAPLTVNPDGSFSIQGKYVLHELNKGALSDTAAVEIKNLVIKGRLGEITGKDNKGNLCYSGECTPVSGNLRVHSVGKKRAYSGLSKYRKFKHSDHYTDFTADISKYDLKIAGKSDIKHEITENPDSHILMIKCPCDMIQTNGKYMKRRISKSGAFEDEEVKVKVTINGSKPSDSYHTNKTIYLFYRRQQ